MPNKKTKSNNKICLVDDDVDHHHQFKDYLDSAYSIDIFKTVEALDEALSEQYLPSLAFVNLDLNDLKGYTACDQIKHHEITSNVPIIGISKSNDLTIKLKSYVLGVEELIQLPIEQGELYSTVDKWATRGNQLNKLEKKADLASSTALEALTQSSELGNIVTFLTHSTEVTSYPVLAKRILDLTKNYGINAYLLISTEEGDLFFGHEITKESTEAKLLSAAQDKGRIIGDSRRVFFNSDTMTMLVKNMPIEDPNRNGRLRDNLLILLNSAEGILQKVYHMHQNESKRKRNTSTALDTFHEEMLLVKNEIHRLGEEVDLMLNQINMKFEASLFSLGLSDDQEAFIQSLLKEGYGSLDNLKRIEMDISMSFGNITEKIRKLI